jgi:hypothetical protein
LGVFKAVLMKVGRVEKLEEPDWSIASVMVNQSAAIIIVTPLQKELVPVLELVVITKQEVLKCFPAHNILSVSSIDRIFLKGVYKELIAKVPRQEDVGVEVDDPIVVPAMG